MWVMRRFLCLVALLPVAALAAPNPKLAEARKFLEDLELEKAARALAAAESQPGNDRGQTLEILTLQGIVFGTMNKDAKVRDAFRKLLILDPDAKLTGDQPPRVRTPFYEAKEWVAQNEPLQLEAVAGPLGKGTELVVTVRRDTLRLVKKVRFLVGAEAPQEAVFENGAARASVEAPVTSWRVELLGAKDAVLLEKGPFPTTGTPVASAPKPEVPPVVPTPEPPPPGAVQAPAAATAAPNGWMRPVSFGLGGAAAVAAGVGIALGVSSSSTRQSLSQLMPNERGLIEGLSQRQALAQEAMANQQAVIANVLFVSAAVLAGTGVVLFLLGAPVERSAVSVSVSPAGVFVTGAFR
jgi:hypothetical protein